MLDIDPHHLKDVLVVHVLNLFAKWPACFLSLQLQTSPFTVKS